MLKMKCSYQKKNSALRCALNVTQSQEEKMFLGIFKI